MNLKIQFPFYNGLKRMKGMYQRTYKKYILTFII